MVYGHCCDCRHHMEYTGICELTGENVQRLEHCCYFRPR